MLRSLLHQTSFLPTSSGILTALAFNNAFLWWMIFGALVPFFLFLFRTKSRHEAFWGGLVFGLIFFGAVISWFLSAHPLTWVGIDSFAISFVVTFLVWMLSAAVMALFTGLFALVVCLIKNEGLGSAVLIPALWVIFEYLRAWGFNIFWAGPGSLISPHWTMGFLGYPLAENTLWLSLASIGGVYLLSFFVVFINTCTALFIFSSLEKDVSLQDRKGRSFVGLILVGLLFALSGSLYTYHAPAETSPPLTIAAFSSSVPSSFQITASEYEEHIAPVKNELFALLEKKSPPDIILLPEDLRILGFLSTAETRALEKAKNLKKPILIIDYGKTRRPSDGARVSSMVYYDTKKGTVGRYDKMFNVPQGEYLSFIVRIVAFMGGQDGWVAQFDKNRSRVKGEGVRTVQFKGTHIGALFCSEITADNLYASAATSQSAEILANASSHVVFGGNPVLAHQVKHMARVRAVENARPFILSGNGTDAFILDHRGRELARTPAPVKPGAMGRTPEKDRGAASFVRATVTPVTSPSPYNRVGNWVVLLSFLLIGAVWVKTREGSGFSA